MRLYLKNVGKVSEADIKLDGITVIAGENNTGKSTVGKMLYCLFDSFYREKEQIDRERKKAMSLCFVAEEKVICQSSFAKAKKELMN